MNLALFAETKGVGWRKPAVAILLIGLFWLGGKQAAAQAVAKPAAHQETVAPKSAEPAAAGETSAPTVALVPPLPFLGPHLAPQRRVNFRDDIEQRTRAFIPYNLDFLTPVQIPQNETKWIRVDLSEQVVVAYERQKPVRAFVISSGLPRTPTVLGEYRIKLKVDEQTMSGEGYHLPGVKWVQYFYGDYSFHGTYWHNNFGRPMSHGCINMTNQDAKWLFDWAGPKWDGKTDWFRSSKANPGTMVIITE